MMPRKSTSKKKVAVEIPANDPLRHYRLLLWLVFGFNALVFWWQCVDRYLAPRFLFLSASLLVCGWLMWRDLKARADWRLHAFDVLLLVWYCWNAASISWAFSWSEAVFYTQKVALLFVVYWLFRQALLRNEEVVRQVLFQATVLLTWTVCGLLLIQLTLAFSKNGLQNEALYDYASALSGNKSLASEFLFFLLVFNVLFYREYIRKSLFYSAISVLLLLIVMLQTRTVYVAVAASTLVYFPVRAWLDASFRPFFLKKLLPLGISALALLFALVAWKGHGNSLAERLNPATYLESVSANERRFVWYKTDLLNQDNFWLGVGNGSWKFWFPSKNIQGGFRLQEQNVVFTRAHNDYLEIRSELGIVGIVLFCAIFGLAFLAGIRSIRKDTDPAVRHDILVLAIGLLGYGIIQYLDFPRERIEMQVILGVLLAYIVFHSRNFWAQLPGLQMQRSADYFLGCWAVILALNVWIGWNRVTGEIHTERAIDAQRRSDYNSLVREARQARNMFNEYNDVCLPLQWHEGIGLYYLDQIEPSIAAFETAYRLNPWAFPVLNNYASALLQHGDTPQAIGLLEKAVEINPKYDEGKLNLSYAYLKLENYTKALEWARRVDTIPNPTNEDARRKNRETLTRQANFMKELEQKMHSDKK